MLVRKNGRWFFAVLGLLVCVCTAAGFSIRRCLDLESLRSEMGDYPDGVSEIKIFVLRPSSDDKYHRTYAKMRVSYDQYLRWVQVRGGKFHDDRVYDQSDITRVLSWPWDTEVNV